MKNANPVSWCAWVLMVAVWMSTGCAKKPEGGERPSIPPLPAEAHGPAAAPVSYTYEVVAAWPHDRGAFTQGLVFHEGRLLESTGLNGQSTLRELELMTGRTLKQVRLPEEIFAEGLAVLGDKAYQLTWKNAKALVYDMDSFRRVGELPYEGEGWGLATDGTSLIMSDGTSRIRFLNPETFAVVRAVEVTLQGKPFDRLNELEYIRGEIFANVWGTDTVARIDPQTGVVRGLIDFSGLLPLTERRADTDVLNGIAYDETADRLFMTGKRWPAVFQVRLQALPPKT